MQQRNSKEGTVLMSIVTLMRLWIIIAVVLCAGSAETFGNYQHPMPGQRTPTAGAKVFDAEQLIHHKLDNNSKIALLFARQSLSQHGGITLGLAHLAIGLLQVL